MIDVDDNNTIVVAGGIVGTVLITLLIVISMIIILWCYSHKGKSELGTVIIIATYISLSMCVAMYYCCLIGL